MTYYCTCTSTTTTHHSAHGSCVPAAAPIFPPLAFGVELSTEHVRGGGRDGLNIENGNPNQIKIWGNFSIIWTAVYSSETHCRIATFVCVGC